MIYSEYLNYKGWVGWKVVLNFKAVELELNRGRVNALIWIKQSILINAYVHETENAFRY